MNKDIPFREGVRQVCDFHTLFFYINDPFPFIINLYKECSVIINLDQKKTFGSRVKSVYLPVITNIPSACVRPVTKVAPTVMSAVTGARSAQLPPLTLPDPSHK